MSVSRKRDHGQGLAGALPLISAPSAAMSGQRQQQQQQEAQQQRFKDRSMLVNHAEILTFLKSNYKYKRRCRSASGVRLPVEPMPMPMPMPQPLPTDGYEGVARAAPATVAARDSAGDSAIVCITDPRGEAKMTATMMEMMARRMTKSDKFSILKLINLSLVVVLTVANVMSRLMTLLLLLLFMLPSTMRPPRQQQNHHHQRQQQEGEEEQEQEQAANRSRAVVAVGRVGDRNRDDGHDVDVNDVVDVDGDEVDDSDVNDDSDETSCQRNHDKLSTLGSRSQPRPLQPQPRRQRCRRPSPRWRRQRHACTRHRWIRVLLPSLSWSASASSSSSSSSSPTPSPGSSSPADCDNHAPVLPIFMALFIALALSVRCAEGGACWQKTLSNGKCSEIYSLNITKDECCAASQDFSFTDRELTSVEYFFATALGGGMECAPCMESCRGVHCGPNKRCAKRKGRPKCICAPECGAATRKRQRGARLLRGAADEHLEAAAVFGKSARDPRSLSAEVRGQHLDGVDGPWRRGRGPDEPVAATQAETAALDRRGRGSAPSSQRQKVVVVQGQRGGRLRGRRMGPGAKAEAEPEARAKASSQGPGQRESPGPQRRLMIVQSRGQHEEKPTTRRLQVISNVNNNNNNQSNSHKRRKGEKMAQKQRQNKESSSSQEVDGRGGRREGEEQEKEEARRGFANAAAATTITQTNTTRKSQSMSRHKQNTSHNNNNNNNNNNDNYNNNKNTSNMQQTKNFDTNNNNSNNHYNNNNNSKLRHIHQSSRQLENTSNHDQQQQPQQQLQQHHGRHHQFRKRKKKLHNKDQQQQQQQQQPAHARADTARPGDVGSNNATAKMTMTTTTVTVSGSGSGSSKTTNTKTTTTTIATLGSTPANSAPSEKPSLNRGSDFATSSGTSSSPASSSSSSSPSSLSSPSSPSSSVSGGERSLSSPGSPGESATDEAAAGVAGIRPGGGGGDAASSGAADDVDGRRSFVNADDLAFDDRIYDKFNLHGIPSQQQVVTHVEKTHSSHHPVCGTDGRTYNTECQLKKRACRTDNADLVVAYHGHCRTSCSGVKCLNGLTCVEDQYAIPNCIACQIACPLDDRHEAEGVAVDEARAVCGVDGQTYRSVCAINRMICRIGRSIGVAYPGPCRDDRVTCADIHCGPKRTCLMDLLTHEPRCVSCRYKCSRKRRPGAVRYEEGRICGVNNRTYNSWCEMRKDSCSTGFFIDVKSLGGCQ